MEPSLLKYPLMQGKVVDMITPPRKSRIVIRKGAEHILLRLEDVILFYTENKVMYLIDSSGKKYVHDKNLSELEVTLNPEMFFRANRKYMVNINYIRSYKTFEKVKLFVEFTLPGINHIVIVSQETAPFFRKWISGF